MSEVIQKMSLMCGKTAPRFAVGPSRGQCYDEVFVGIVTRHLAVLSS